MKGAWCCLLLCLAVSLSEAAKNYKDALAKSILFYAAQRSGYLPSNNPISWRGDSATGDCVVGGWYDAGDHVKFGLPYAFAVTTLGQSLVRFKTGYEAAGQLDEMYQSLGEQCEYMVNSWDPNNKVLVVQIGDGNADHAYWGRPEEMTMYRPCNKANQGTPATDIAANYAAALATCYISFNDKGDNVLAWKYLAAARTLYDFAKNTRGIYYGSSPFYTSSGDQDELAEAAAWLYKATGETNYLNDGYAYTADWAGWAYGWDDKKASAQIAMYEATGDWKYRNAIESYFKNDWFEGAGITYTPCGLAWRDSWGATRYAANSAFIALCAAQQGILTTELRKWAVEQINYILGDNNVKGGCFSFEIGYGSNYPLNPHHRGASCPDKPASCGDAQQYASGPSPQILYGALVGGPDSNDNYQDVRTDYVQNEVALDYNAGFQGALAGIAQLEKQGQLPSTNNKCPC